MNIVITGANRGLGFGFVQHYLELGYQVWACYRWDMGLLNTIASDDLHCVRWDVAEDAIPLDDLPLRVDLLINNAGVYGSGKDGQSLENISMQEMMNVFNIDCLGALRAVQALQPALCAAKGSIANISSKMGSSEDNSSGGTYAYRAAKAALVIVSKSMAIDLAAKGVDVITLHPGWVKTDMTRNTGLIDVKTSVAGMTDVIERIADYELGSFVAYDGQVVPF